MQGEMDWPDWPKWTEMHEHPLDTRYAPEDPEGRASMLLYVAELAHIRGDKDLSWAYESRAWAILDCVNQESPARYWGAEEQRVFGTPTLYYYDLR